MFFEPSFVPPIHEVVSDPATDGEHEHDDDDNNLVWRGGYSYGKCVEQHTLL